MESADVGECLRGSVHVYAFIGQVGPKKIIVVSLRLSTQACLTGVIHLCNSKRVVH